MRPLHVACIALAIAIAFFIGRFTAEPPLAPLPSTGTQGESNRVPGSALPLDVTNPAGNGETSGAGAIAGSAEDKDLIQAIGRAASEPTGLGRHMAISQALQGVTSANWRAVHQTIWKARLAGMISEAEQQLFLQRFGDVAGADALMSFRPKDPVNDWETHSGRFAMRGWAERDPAAARAWLETQPEGKFRTGMLNGYLGSTALRDAPTALAALRALAAPADEPWLVRSLVNSSEGARYTPFFQEWIEKGGAEGPGAADIFTALVQSRLRMDWKGGSEEMERWFEPFVGQPYISQQAMHQVLPRITKNRQPQEALPWVERFPVGSQARKAGSEVIFTTWAATEPDTLGTWLAAEREHPDYDTGVFQFLNSKRGQLDQATKEAWINSIKNENIRTRAVRATADAQPVK